MEHEPGDDYIRRIAAHIRANEQGLAAAAYHRKRRAKASATDTGTSYLNPLAWFGASDTAAPSSSVKPVVLSFDAHHLFYLLMRMEALGIDVGSLDIKVDNPSRPMNYVNIFNGTDKSDALSLRSFATSFSAVSRLSLGAGWWGRPPPPSVDAELKYIYSCFTRLPAISLHAPEPRLIAELAHESPNENALPVDALKSLQSLECMDVDPRALLGWDRMADSLWSLTIKRSGLEDVSDIFISAVLKDQALRGRAPPSRQGSFYGTRLPDSVPEDAEDAPSSPIGDVHADNISQRSPIAVDNPPSEPSLPAYKWSTLRYLSLADNALTFLPTTPLPYLTSVTHLDLSSNLLVSVPPGLSALYSLVSLNLADNMIDSVLGIYTMLGQVLHLNLSRNRLESICGLERLRALERVDLRHNVIEESAEVGRLATLPNISEVWIEGNPLTELEEGYRIRCFDLFLKEGRSILLDGTPPGFYEKRYLSSSPSQQMTSSRPISTAYSPPAVPISSPPRQAPPVAASSSEDTVSGPSKDSPTQSPPTSSPPSHNPSPHLAAVGARGRRKKNKRIVDLDGGSESTSRSASHSRITSDAAGAGRGASAAARATSPAKSVIRPKPTEVKVAAEPAQPVAGTSSETPTAIRASVTAPENVSSMRVKPKSRHGRHHTEYTPTGNGRSAMEDLLSTYNQEDSTPAQSVGHRRSATMTKSAARRARVSASVYEPPPAEKDGKGEAERQRVEAEAFRARIEALRSDMGEGWLKVFNQSHMSSPPATGVPSG
ncbi:hypothetical protein BXZ70DRAFT_913571 [Cristinia sonorae]|uniref:Leucine rich repeat domain-containing protein n=1 Tax=Cristinia sonorae TaxID=1940300 RepID=A0A8K0XV76_9AGAR|nr:hypothetical protein BXZ70DRAFT_913571 [Cristinia sonorae]